MQAHNAQRPASLSQTTHAGQPPAHPAAQQKLYDAILFANERDFPKLLDKALRDGARLDTAFANGDGVLEVAVRRGNVRIAQLLMAKGADTQDINMNQVDVLMQAAKYGHADMVAYLIDFNFIVPTYADVHGQTALLYAVKAGHKDAAQALLVREADPNALTTAMTAEDCEEIFGESLETKGDKVTPLLVAIAQSDLEMVKLLLNFGAKPEVGTMHALFFAIRKNNAEIISALLHAGACHEGLVSKAGFTPLQSAVLQQCTTECLKLLLDAHSMALNQDLRKDAPLKLALELGYFDGVAFLLKNGAALDEDKKVDHSVWKLAEAQTQAAQLLDLLAAAKWQSAQSALHSKAPDALLTALNKSDFEDAELASLGLCRPLRDILSTMDILEHMGTVDLSEAQESNLLAHALIIDSKLQSIEHSNPDAFPATQKAAPEQAALLRQQARHKFDAMLAKLPTFLNQTFFEQMVSEVDEGGSLRQHMVKHLEAEGIPELLVDFIAISWKEAALSAVEWQVAPNDISACNAYVSKLASNAVMSLLYATRMVPDGVEMQCLHALQAALAETEAHLNAFYNNPELTLRRIENRQGLQKVNLAQLHLDLCLSLGLPSPFCQGLVTIWSEAVNQVRANAQLNTPVAMHRALTRAFSQKLKAMLMADGPQSAMFDNQIMDKRKQQLLRWCNANGAEDSISSNSSKRKPESGPDEEPGSKQPRKE
ncbi:MAG: ankyrin repeat domain-containing protein [Burkholderiaceae bacterium]